MLDLLKRKWKMFALIGGVVIVAGGLGWYFTGNKSTTTTSSVNVSVRKGSIQVSVFGTGAVKPVTTKNITSKVSGTISKINFSNGQQIKKGDLLFVINSDSTQSAVKKAELELQQAQLDYNSLVDQINQQPADSSQSTQNANKLASQQLKLEQAKLSLTDAQKKLSDLNIYAPVDGVVTLGSQSSQGSGAGSGSSSSSSSGYSANSSSSSSSSSTGTQDYWQVGDDVSSSQSLATLVGTDGMTVTVAVDETDLSKIKLEQKANITVDALPDKKFQGTVKEIANEGTQSNGVARFDVIVSIDQPEGLKTNMTANVEIMVASKNDALLLPIEAVQERQGRKFVIKPNNGTNSQKVANTSEQSTGTSTNQKQLANMVVVETGLYNETWIEITSGLQEGDTVTLPNVTRSSSTNNLNKNGNKQFMGDGGGMFFGGGGRPGQTSRTGGSSSSGSGAK